MAFQVSNSKLEWPSVNANLSVQHSSQQLAYLNLNHLEVHLNFKAFWGAHCSFIRCVLDLSSLSLWLSLLLFIVWVILVSLDDVLHVIENLPMPVFCSFTLWLMMAAIKNRNSYLSCTWHKRDTKSYMNSFLWILIFMNSEFIFMNSEKWFHSFVYGHEFIYDDYNFMTRIHGWFYKHKSMSYMLWPINSDMSSWTLTTCCICIGGYLLELRLPGVLFPNSSGIKAAAKTHLKWRILKNMFEFRGYQCSRDQKPWKLSHKSSGTIETILIW